MWVQQSRPLFRSRWPPAPYWRHGCGIEITEDWGELQEGREGSDKIVRVPSRSGLFRTLTLYTQLYTLSRTYWYI